VIFSGQDFILFDVCVGDRNTALLLSPEFRSVLISGNERDKLKLLTQFAVDCFFQ